MSQQSPLPCVLLDADVIIFAHESNVWGFLCKNCKLATGSIIANEESKYYQSANMRITINCSDIRAVCQVHELEAKEIGTVFRKLDTILEPDEVVALDEGEAEIIALFLNDKVDDELFCTGDRAAIKVMTVLGFDNRCVSLARVLASTNYPENLTLPWEYTDEFIRHYVNEGGKLIR
jgi:hypothetical protein